MKGNQNKKLLKKGSINCKIKKYSKDLHSNSVSTNKARWNRLLFLAHQLSRDAGVQLLIFGYFPNETVGSCGSWSFGKTTKLLEEKSDTRKYYKYWENVFSLIEAHRQNKETVEVEKCHKAATFNVGASVKMNSDGASAVENESEDTYLEEESEVGAFEEIIISPDENNSMETLESVEFESVKTISQLQKLMDSANTTQSSVSELILNIDPVTSTVSFPPLPQHATVTGKTSSPSVYNVPNTRMPSVSVRLDHKAIATPPATKYFPTTPLPTDSSSTLLVPLDAICVSSGANASETPPVTKDPATTSPPTNSDPAPPVSAVVRNQPPWSNAKKRTVAKVLASTLLPAASSPTPSVSATLNAQREQPPLKKSKKTEAEDEQTNKTTCNADVCLEPSLVSTGVIWEFSDKVPTMPNNNREAVLALLNREEELIKDAIEELEQVVDASINDEMDSDDQTVIDRVGLELQPSIRGLVKRVIALIRRTKKVVTNFHHSDQNILDSVAEKVSNMTTEVDDLICSLYAPINVKIAVESGTKLSSKLEDLLKTVKGIAGEDDMAWIELLSKAVQRNVRNLQSKGASG